MEGSAANSSKAKNSLGHVTPLAQRQSRTSLKLITDGGRSALYDLIVEGFEKTGTIKGAARYAGFAASESRSTSLN
jgi:hypothetical protein